MFDMGTVLDNAAYIGGVFGAAILAVAGIVWKATNYRSTRCLAHDYAFDPKHPNRVQCRKCGYTVDNSEWDQ